MYSVVIKALNYYVLLAILSTTAKKIWHEQLLVYDSLNTKSK